MVGEVIDGKVVVVDGAYVHEAWLFCNRLEQAHIPFEVCQVSKSDAGVVEDRRNNWATGLGTVVNYFNQGGLGVYLRILVCPEDLERAKAAIDQSPKTRGVDRKLLAIWIVVAIVMALLVYAFVDRARREILMDNYGRRQFLGQELQY